MKFYVKDQYFIQLYYFHRFCQYFTTYNPKKKEKKRKERKKETEEESIERQKFLKQ